MPADPPVAVVTGAGSGIGRAIAHRFADSGLRILVNDLDGDRARTVCREIAARGGDAQAHTGDVSDPDQVDSLAVTARDRARRVDILVNNAGLGEAPTPIADQDPARWQRLVDVLLRGPYLCSRRLGTDFMVPARHGRIICIASIAGTIGLPGTHAYSSAKAALIMFARTLACEWARHGITVNAIAPGYIETTHVRHLVETGRLDADTLRRRIPIGRLGAPDDVAHAVAFLASEQAGYITGSTLTVDGGWTAYGGADDAAPTSSPD